jgi:hypothetical protein
MDIYDSILGGLDRVVNLLPDQNAYEQRGKRIILYKLRRIRLKKIEFF